MNNRLELALHSKGPIPLSARLGCEPGQLLALCGPSGSGKTTLIKAIAGLLPHKTLQGSIRLGEHCWLDSESGKWARPQDRGVGLVFQHYALFPHLSALENVTLSATGRDNSPATLAMAHEWLHRLGLAGLAQRKPRELSGGQQQRVALARALFQNPRVLLLDEPFSAVDTATRQGLYQALAQLRQSVSCPMVLVTHDLLEARQLADQVVVLHEGTTLQAGPPEQVFARPRNAVVAQIVGIQNLFTGILLKQGSGFTQRALLAWTDVSGNNAPTIYLEVQDKGKIAHQCAVHWVIAGQYLEVSPTPPTSAQQANTVPFILKQVAQLGEISMGTLSPEALPGVSMVINLSTRELRQWGVCLGERLYVRLPIEGIHIMPTRTS